MPVEREKTFSLTFKMENAAFADGQHTAEMMRILGEVRGKIATGRYSGRIIDVNGNHIGDFLTTWRADPKPDKKPAIITRKRKS